MRLDRGLLLIVSLGLGLAAPAAHVRAATVRVALASLPPDNGAPFGSRARAAWYAKRPIFDTLTVLGPNMEAAPALAVAWRNPDPMTWVVSLRPGVVFSNGEPCDAAAVAFTYDYLRTPAGVERALGTVTVNAGVFMRADRRPSDRDLAALVRALVEAEQLIATSSATELADKLPRAVVGNAEEFERRLETARTLYLPGGLVTVPQVSESLGIVRAHMPFSPGLKIPRPQELIYAPAVKPTSRPAR